MNTPAHLLIGAAAFGRAHSRPVIWAAFAGAMVPDLSLYLLAGISLFVLQIPAQVVFDDLYFSALWQTIFAIDNSALVWGGTLALAALKRNRVAIAFTGAALLHVALDFPLHHDDGRPHFWPLSGWVFESPFSYWDRSHGANWIAPLELLLALFAAALIVSRKPGWPIVLFTVVLSGAELMVVRTWLWVFVSG